jgi:hypothetical protein
MAGHPSTHPPSYEGMGSPRNILGNQQLVLHKKSRVPEIYSISYRKFNDIKIQFAY